MSEIGPSYISPAFISKALRFVNRHPYWFWPILAVYAITVTLPHTKVQWLVNEFAIRYGHPALYRLTAAIVAALGLTFTALALRALRKQPHSRLVAGLWFLTMALIVGAWAGLTGNNVELVHYPQYFPEGIALAALTLSPVDALGWVVFFGGLDEAYQFWMLPRSRVSLYDFNDIYMDLLGGAAGVVFALAFLRGARRSKPASFVHLWKRPGPMIIASIAAAGAVLCALGLVLVVENKADKRHWFALGDFQAPSFWAHVLENGPKHYHTFTPLEGVILIFGTIALYGALTRGWTFFTPGTLKKVPTRPL